jgi:hypothetical protein
LLIGVDEKRDPSTRLKVAHAIVPIPDPDEMKQWIEQATRRYLAPSTFTREVVIVPDQRGTVIAVNVPASRQMVALWDQDSHAVEYLYRTSHGKEWMNPDEAERHLMNGSRAARIAVDNARAKASSHEVELAGGYWLRRNTGADQRWKPNGAVVFGTVGPDWFELRVPVGSQIAVVTIPYGLVDEAWVGASGRVNLLLGVRAIVADGEVALESRR